MKLVANGCSYTWGGEIISNEFSAIEPNDDIAQNMFREKNVYAGHLHLKLNTEQYHNLAIYGGSNHRIVRTTLDFFTKRLNDKDDLSDYLAIIQWSEVSRFEVYSDWRQNYFNFHSHRSVDESNLLDPVMEKNLIELYKSRRTLNPINFENDFVINLICLDSFFRLHKIKYLYCHMCDIYVDLPYQMNWLNKDCKNDSLMSIAKDNLYQKKHPNLKGHEIIAERIYNRLNELYNI